MKEESCYYEIDYTRQQSIAAMAKIVERFAESGEGTPRQRSCAREAAARMNELLDALEDGEEQNAGNGQ